MPSGAPTTGPLPIGVLLNAEYPLAELVDVARSSEELGYRAL
jgi:hypothetical protein